jgi:hypothetical protein
LRGFAVLRLIYARQQFANLFIRPLRKILVPATDRIESSGVIAQMTSSAIFFISTQVSGDAVGTATTMRAGFWCRSASIAACMVARRACGPQRHPAVAPKARAIGNRHTAARQSQHEHVRAIGIGHEFFGEPPVRFPTITKESWVHIFSSRCRAAWRRVFEWVAPATSRYKAAASSGAMETVRN